MTHLDYNLFVWTNKNAQMPRTLAKIRKLMLSARASADMQCLFGVHGRSLYYVLKQFGPEARIPKLESQRPRPKIDPAFSGLLVPEPTCHLKLRVMGRRVLGLKLQA